MKPSGSPSWWPDAHAAYLGDGLYAAFDGYQILLGCGRENGWEYVALEPSVLESFRKYADRLFNNEEV